MKTPSFAVAVLLASGFLAVSRAAPRSALIVGISTYPKDGALATLPNPVNDAKLLSGALEKANFKVILATDVSRGQLKAKLDEFVDQIDPGGAAVVYFAGHGMQWEGKNFLLAGNAKLQRKYDLGEEALEADTVLNALADKKPKTALVFLDCCRVPPSSSWLMSDKQRSQTRSGLAAMEHADLLISYAAAPGQPAEDGRDGNSPYAKALAKNILSGQELTKMLKTVTGEVLADTGNKQRPYQTGSLLEDFYFTPGVSLPNPTPPPAGDPAKLATRDRPFTNALGLEFVPVPGKSGLLMCRTETRVRDFRAYATAANYKQTGGMFVMKVTGSEKEGYGTEWKLDENASWEKPGFTQSEDHPVVGVSWNEAREFCAWLSKKEGRTYRLPSDAEWSAAVGVGKYPWGSNWPAPKNSGNYAGTEFKNSLPKANWQTAYDYDDGAARTAAVASYAENRSGFYDLGGNVWEWCEDTYKASMNSAEVLEQIPALKKEVSNDGTPYRVLRGGSWILSDPARLSSSCRGGGHPTYRNDGNGIRVVLVVGSGG